MSPAAAEPLTPERILETTEEVLRRFGPGKATVVDVARALGVSHGSVYRHFPSKAALREAVTDRWLAKSVVMLEGIASAPAETAPSSWSRGWRRSSRPSAARPVPIPSCSPRTPCCSPRTAGWSTPT